MKKKWRGHFNADGSRKQSFSRQAAVEVAMKRGGRSYRCVACGRYHITVGKA